MAVTQRLREGTTFSRFASDAATLAGTPWAFMAAIASAVVWY
jgi:low affinity Fe/Cu permease